MGPIFLQKGCGEAGIFEEVFYLVSFAEFLPCIRGTRSADWLNRDSKRLINEKQPMLRCRRAEVREILNHVAEEKAADRRKQTGYDKHAREDRHQLPIG